MRIESQSTVQRSMIFQAKAGADARLRSTCMQHETEQVSRVVSCDHCHCGTERVLGLGAVITSSTAHHESQCAHTHCPMRILCAEACADVQETQQ